MTEEQIKQNAKEWVKPLIGEEDGGYNENDVSLSLMENAFIDGAHSRDEEIERLESLLDKAVHLLRETNSGFDFFCERLQEIPEEDSHCMIYCDKDDIRCDCVLRYLKHYKKGEK